MIRLLAILLLLLPPALATARVRVVATLPDLGAIARAVGGDDVHVQVLASAGEDPHYVDPRPDRMLALSRADLLLENGLELEVGWLPRLVVGSRNARIQRGGKGRLDASAVIHPLEVHGSADRSLGDVHPAGNPHYTYDPRAIRAVAAALGNTLSALDPPHAAAYQQRSAALQAKLKSFAVREAKRFRALPEARRRVVSFHKSFAYLYDWLGLTEVATVEPLPGVPPDPGHVAEVLGVIRRTGAKAIIQQEYYPRRTSDTLARLGKATVVVLPGGVAPNQSIIDYLQSITDAVYAALAK